MPRYSFFSVTFLTVSTSTLPTSITRLTPTLLVDSYFARSREESGFSFLAIARITSSLLVVNYCQLLPSLSTVSFNRSSSPPRCPSDNHRTPRPPRINLAGLCFSLSHWPFLHAAWPSLPSFLAVPLPQLSSVRSSRPARCVLFQNTKPDNEH